jgi:hypothetical protein
MFSSCHVQGHHVCEQGSRQPGQPSSAWLALEKDAGCACVSCMLTMPPLAVWCCAAALDFAMPPACCPVTGVV